MHDTMKFRDKRPSKDRSHGTPVPIGLVSYGPTLWLSSCSHRGEVGGLTASWDGSKVTAAEYAGMHGHCHALVDQEPRRGEQASRWTLEMTVGSGAPQQFLRLGLGQAKVLALEELGMGTTAS
jgi:hypothetical protein